NAARNVHGDIADGIHEIETTEFGRGDGGTIGNALMQRLEHLIAGHRDGRAVEMRGPARPGRAPDTYSGAFQVVFSDDGFRAKQSIRAAGSTAGVDLTLAGELFIAFRAIEQNELRHCSSVGHSFLAVGAIL